MTGMTGMSKCPSESKLSHHLSLRHQRPESPAQTHHFGGKLKIADFHDIRLRQEPPLWKWSEICFIWRSIGGVADWLYQSPDVFRINHERLPRHCKYCFTIVYDVTRHDRNRVFSGYTVIVSPFYATLFWPSFERKYSDHYCLSMETTSSQSCDINWLVFLHWRIKSSRICRVSNRLQT
jgi:hypothetical protein